MPSDPSLVRDELLHELFEAAADRFPDRLAVESGAVRLTYRELEGRANRLARRLRGLGLGRERTAAVLLPRGELVYEAVLGILKAGAAYLPLDADAPAERSRFILEDAGASALVTTREAAGALLGGLPPGVRPVLLDEERGHESRSSERLTRRDTGTGRGDIAYVIFTSGTTGRPKGVAVEHRSAAHFVRAESSLLDVRPEDRVLQLASLAFDLSIEEIWLAFFRGAALVAADKELAHSGPDFARRLEALGVTVLSCVPTFLSMVEEDLPSVRLLILGGEACPDELAARWLKAGRAVFNTYGPTEATVTATAARLEAGEPVTIGRPLPNVSARILDGELCLGGEGLARGYVRRPNLEKEKFVVVDGERLYRTGDRARLDEKGRLVFLGRLDAQVKVRGHRIELEEIEAALIESEEVLAAAAAVEREGQRLVAFVVPRSGARLDPAGLRRRLAAKLPSYMVPRSIGVLSELPTTSTGKIDRARLPAAPPSERGEGPSPRSPGEKAVAEAWKEALGEGKVSIADDFFSDLGGHSLLAARAVSALRRAPGFERVSVADLYAHPTVEALARLAAPPAEAPPREGRLASGPRSHLLCGLAQAAALLLVSSLYAWQWLGAYLAYAYLAVADRPLGEALAGGLAVQLLTFPSVLLFAAALKWLLLGKVRPGRHPLWGGYYLRFWLVRAVLRATPIHYLDGTPFLAAYFRLMGARIGKGVYLSSHDVTAFDLLSIGDGSSVGIDVALDGAAVVDGRLELAETKIGRGCFVGNRCALGLGASLEDGAGLDDLSMLPDGAAVPAGELWSGSPASPAGRLEAEPERNPWSPAGSAALLAGVFALPLVILAAVFPGLMAITELGHLDEGYRFLAVSPLVALSFVLLLCGGVWALKRVLVGRVREGRYPVGGSFYVRKWFLDQVMTLSFELTETLYETLYIQPWLRSLGAAIGPRTEVAAQAYMEPDLVELGEECMLADLVLLAPPKVRSGWMTLGRASLGRRVFVGNGAVVQGGTRLEDGVLVGAFSEPPGRFAAAGGSWFGSPPIALPRRYRSEAFPEERTFRPPRSLVAQRLFIEAFRVLLPSTLFVVLASLIVNATDILQDYIGFKEWLATLPFFYIAAGLAAILTTAGLKWLLVGRYRPGERPLWCVFVWLSDLVTGVYDNLCGVFFLDMLRGTPFLPWALRLFGMKVGRRCYVDTTWFTEFDLVELGDETALNDNVNLQTHLFEDRIMKMGTVRVGAGCTVGTNSTVLYDTELGEGAVLGDLSLLMKGERLPAGTAWHGNPARRA